MHWSNSPINRLELKHCILSSAYEIAVLFGLVGSKWPEIVYAERKGVQFEYTVCKKELPNKYARIDILRVNGSPAGTVVSVELDHGVYHMVGMFVKEAYRSKHVCDTLRINGLEEDEQGGAVSPPASFLLESLVGDLVKNRCQMTLEVMNNNRGAIQLYEKKFSLSKQKGAWAGFELLSKDDVLSYARHRRKRIKQWHSLGEREGIKRYGVQWAGTPKFGDSLRWSISRIYGIKPTNEPFLLSKSRTSRRGIAMRAGWTILRYGNPLLYILIRLAKPGS